MGDIKQKSQYYFVATMLDIVGRSLVASSQVDEKIQQELAKFPVGLVISMNVFSNELGFFVRVTENKQLELLSKAEASLYGVDLSVQFKHLKYAFLVLSFQESTAQAFANDRMTVDGNLAYAIRLVRCLNQLESVILPKAIAIKAVKEYPARLELKQKLAIAGKVYFKVAISYLRKV